MYDCTAVRLYGCKTVRPYKVLLLTCMVNCIMGTSMPRLCIVVQWSVHWALSWTTRVLVLAGSRCCALETCREKKMWALLLGLAKSIYYHSMQVKSRDVCATEIQGPGYLVKFPYSPILLLNKSVFPMAMYYFCHCFLYPRTECIM